MPYLPRNRYSSRIIEKVPCGKPPTIYRRGELLCTCVIRTCCQIYVAVTAVDVNARRCCFQTLCDSAGQTSCDSGSSPAAVESDPRRRIDVVGERWICLFVLRE